MTGEHRVSIGGSQLKESKIWVRYVLRNGNTCASLKEVSAARERGRGGDDWCELLYGWELRRGCTTESWQEQDDADDSNGGCSHDSAPRGYAPGKCKLRWRNV